VGEKKKKKKRKNNNTSIATDFQTQFQEAKRNSRDCINSNSNACLKGATVFSSSCFIPCGYIYSVLQSFLFFRRTWKFGFGMKLLFKNMTTRNYNHCVHFNECQVPAAI
jgi:hypothetical protein